MIGTGTQNTTIALTATTQVVATGGSMTPHSPAIQIPVSITLISTAGGRAIQLSTDGGLNFWPAVTPTLTSTPEIQYTCAFPITHIQVTSSGTGDKLVLVY